MKIHRYGIPAPLPMVRVFLIRFVFPQLSSLPIILAFNIEQTYLLMILRADLGTVLLEKRFSIENDNQNLMCGTISFFFLLIVLFL